MPDQQSALPIDRGWAWMVLLGACLNQFMVLCVGRSLGLLFVALINHYEASATAASIMQAILAAISFSIGPIVSPLSDVFTCRRVVMLGGCFLCLAGVICYFAQSLEAIVYPFGIIGGFGVGMVLSLSPIILSRYFDQRRALANGLLFTAAGASGVVGPLLMTASLQIYGIHGTMLLAAGWMLHILVGGALFRPLTVPPRLAVNEPDAPNGECQPKDDSGRTNDTVYFTARERLGSMSSVNFRPRVGSGTGSAYTSALNLATLSIQDIPAELREPISDIKQVSQERKEGWSCSRLCSRMCTVRTSEGDTVPLIDCKLFKHPPVFLLAIGATLATCSFYLNMLTPAHCSEGLGLSKKDVGLLLVILGVSETFGRLLVALSGDSFWFKPHRCTIGAAFMLVSAVATFLSLWANGFWSQALFVTIAPIGTGGFIALHVTILVDLVGAERLTRVWGLVLLCEGAGAAGTPLVIGLLRDWTGDYTAAYQFVGVAFLIAALTIVMIPVAFRKFKDPYSKSGDEL